MKTSDAMAKVEQYVEEAEQILADSEYDEEGNVDPLAYQAAATYAAIAQVYATIYAAAVRG